MSEQTTAAIYQGRATIAAALIQRGFIDVSKIDWGHASPDNEPALSKLQQAVTAIFNAVTGSNS